LFLGSGVTDDSRLQQEIDPHARDVRDYVYVDLRESASLAKSFRAYLDILWRMRSIRLLRDTGERRLLIAAEVCDQ